MESQHVELAMLRSHHRCATVPPPIGVPRGLFGGWVGGKCFPYLSWPWKGWRSRSWHWFIDTRDVSPFKDEGKKVQWKHWNYIFNNWEFEFPTQKLENSQSAGIRTSLSTKPNQQTARLWIWWLEDNPFVLEWSFHGTSKYSLFKGHIN